MENIITRSQIKNIGKRLRQIKINDQIKAEDLKVLNQWRQHHEPTLNYFGKLLKQGAEKLGLNNKQYTVTQRIKRIHSIILKLQRFPQMQLSTMDDIAGTRLVLPLNSEVKALMDVFKEKKSKHKINKIKNYISHPKNDGYRSVHIIYGINKNPSLQIEMQLRSQLQHCWATGVEIFGTLEKTSFKTGAGTEPWKEFFKFLSSKLAIKEDTPVLEEHEKYSESQLNRQLISMIRQLNIIEQLNSYTSIYSSSWRETRPKGRGGKYALVTLDSNKNNTTVKLYAENQFSQALEKYAEVERSYHSSNEINIVLVNLNNVDNLEKAYPNYFMDSKQLTNYLSKIVLGEF